MEETKQDRIDALNKAYNSRAEFAAASAKVMAEIDETFHGGNYGEGFIDELQKKVMESWHNAVDEKNMPLPDFAFAYVNAVSDTQLFPTFLP